MVSPARNPDIASRRAICLAALKNFDQLRNGPMAFDVNNISGAARNDRCQ
jgi:hypothetical protein